MPELPEVLTTIKHLKPKVLGQKIVCVWFDRKTKIENLIKKSSSPNLINQKIDQITNIGKYLIFNLTGQQTLIIHQKISGHLLIGKFKRENNFLKPISPKSPLNDPVNRFARFGLKLKNNYWLVLSDSRRLARITFLKTKDINNLKPIRQMGLNPLSKEWIFASFKTKLLKHNIAIKPALLSQNIISGLGNIYSDEVLFKSKIHPQRKIQTLTELELKKLFKFIPLILKKAIEVGGTTFATYRTPTGEIGSYYKFLNVYGRKNQPCKFCKYTIQSIKIGGRSSCFCKHCQK